MKKLVFFSILLLGFLISQESKAVVKVHTFTSSNQQFGGGDPTTDPSFIKYEQVKIYCNPYTCDLDCDFPTDIGGNTCEWGNADACFGCLNYNWRDLFWDPSNASDLYDDALDEIIDGNYTGNYSLNYTNPTNSITYYRTVSWSFDSTTLITDINISISYDDGL